MCSLAEAVSVAIAQGEAPASGTLISAGISSCYKRCSHHQTLQILLTIAHELKFLVDARDLGMWGLGICSASSILY